MNTNDFYKELFEKYALNEDKIRRNAIKAATTPAWKKTLGTHWRSFAGAAAAVAVTVGAVTYAVSDQQKPGVDIVSSDNVRSASQRLREAESNYYNSPDEIKINDLQDIYVTFANPVCFSDMKVSFSALDSAENIETEKLYLTDGSVISNAEGINAFSEASGSSKVIAGAKLCAPAGCFKDINDLSSVLVAELGSAELNDDNFVPLRVNDLDNDPLSGDAEQGFISTTAVTPAVTTTAFSFRAETTPAPVTEGTSASTEDISADTTAPADAPDDTTSENTESEEYTEPTASETSVTTAPREIDETDETTTSKTTPATSASTKAPETAETTVSATEMQDAPAIGLMTQIYQLNVSNAVDTIFVNDYAIVFTRSDAYIYRLGGIITSQGRKFASVNPKLAYSDDNTVIITGCGSDGLRNKIIVLDQNSGSVYINNDSVTLGEAETGTFNPIGSTGKFLLKAVSASKTYFYEMSLDSAAGMQLRPLLECDGAVSAAGYGNNLLWYTAKDESGNTCLYSFNCVSGEQDTVKTFTTCKVRARSYSFESFIIQASDEDNVGTQTYIFDTASAKLVPAEIDESAQIAVKNGITYVSYGGKTYQLTAAGVLTETTAKISFTNKPGSKYGIVSSDSEKIEVAERTTGWRSNN